MRENAIFNVLYREIFSRVNKLRLISKSLNGTLLLLARYLCILFTEPCDKLKAIPLLFIILHTPLLHVTNEGILEVQSEPLLN